MGSKMLIDAAHPEETRVVVVRGNRVEEFDYESAQRKQLRGNIYLAKVTRVEPSLQAAFVDYGGNRHGFLAFSEIHPDYYQIPVADRQALLEEEAEEESRALAEEAEDDENGNGRNGNSRRRGRRRSGRNAKESRKREDEDAATPEALEAASTGESISGEIEAGTDGEEPSNDADEESGLEANEADTDVAEAGEDDDEDENVESVGSEDAMEEVPVRTRRRRKRIYKIQEVIKRRQIILVQVVKEERGNKGAALTTYLSLAGRYTVLMPNTARGGGISRKITNATDRKRLRKIAGELDIADGMGLIIRTAGASRTKTEVKRDCEYLLRMWETIRDLTLKSTAPALVYEEGNLIKRSIRDLYNKEIDEIQVAGDEAYKEAKGFMRMLMPSHAKNVQPYKEPQPIFVRHKIERQLSAMFSPYVTLKSGGYIVINQTEALVSIDVNSGKATREHSIEDTALRTNLEAAEEVARQLRLRDLAGLIVIDFIDMDERRNNRAVERKIKEALRGDRARIQVGRISHFGLLEMSRQRLRTGMLEGTTDMCPMCQGMGTVRSTESVALDVLRSLEDTLISQGISNLRALVSSDAALYILNHKRALVRDIESRYSISILIHSDPDLHGASFSIEKTTESSDDAVENTVIQMDTIFQTPEQEDAEAAREGESDQGDEDDDQSRRRRRRRRRGRGGRGRGGDRDIAADSDSEERGEEEDTVEESAAGERETQDGDDPEAGGSRRRPRRRGRRGGRRTRSAAAAASAEETPAPEEAETPETVATDSEEPAATVSGSEELSENKSAEGEEPEEKKPARKPRRSSTAKSAAKTPRKRSSTKSAEKTNGAASEEHDKAASGNGHEKAETTPSPVKEEKAPPAPVQADEKEASDEEPESPRRGWWQRRA